MGNGAASSRRKGYKVGCQVTSQIGLRLKIGVRSQWGNGILHFLKWSQKSNHITWGNYACGENYC